MNFNAKRFVATTFILFIILVSMTVAEARRKAPDGCTVYSVVSGDTASAIAARHGIAWTTFTETNKHIPNMNLIFPGDEMVVGACDHPTEALPVPVLDAASVTLESHNGRLTPTGICRLVSTKIDGAAGPWDPIVMTAVALQESGGATGIQGDLNIQNGTWGPSVGVLQVRSLWADRGTGRARDIDRLTDVWFNIESARQIFDGKRPNGSFTRYQAWGAYTHPVGNPDYLKHMDRARAGCKEAGIA
jgi:hypothetical protein